MNRNCTEKEALNQAKENLKDLHARGDEAIGGDALALIDSLLTKEEIEQRNLRVALVGEIIKARQEKGISQRKLEELSGVKQPVIARIESTETYPRIDTIIKLLVPLGKTLAVVPLKK